MLREAQSHVLSMDLSLSTKTEEYSTLTGKERLKLLWWTYNSVNTSEDSFFNAVECPVPQKHN